MDDGLKQRLVGALVLLALGVLFIPVLFEPAHRHELDRTSQIPAAPGILPIQVEEPVKNPQIHPAKAEQEQFVADDRSGGYRLLTDDENKSDLAKESEQVNKTELEEPKVVEPKSVEPDAKAGPTSSGLVPKSPEPERKVLDPAGLPGSWLVQVASFTSEKRAQVLRDQLLKDNYPAFTRTLKTSKGQVTRVYVGPKINRNSALTTKAELDKSLRIDALVVKFSP